LGATLSCTTSPVRWTVGAAQARAQSCSGATGKRPHPSRSRLHPVGLRKSAWPVSCSDALGSAVRHDDQPCPFVCSI
jgi:hypothetical protein